MYINKLYSIIIGFIFCFIIFCQENVYSADGHISYSLDKILEKVGDANSRLKTMDADIKYSRAITLLDSEEISLGYLQYKKPKKLNLNFYPPRNEINVIDGKYIWVYHLKEKQVEKYKIITDSDSPQGMGIFELGYEYETDKVKENYNITLLDSIATNEEALYHIELIPKESYDSEYDRILLWVREGLWLPVQYQMFESDGEIVNTIELTNIQVNPNIPEKVFVLDLPDDVEVLEPFE